MHVHACEWHAACTGVLCILTCVWHMCVHVAHVHTHVRAHTSACMWAEIWEGGTQLTGPAGDHTGGSHTGADVLTDVSLKGTGCCEGGPKGAGCAQDTRGAQRMLVSWVAAVERNRRAVVGMQEGGQVRVDGGSGFSPEQAEGGASLPGEG